MFSLKLSLKLDRGSGLGASIPVPVCLSAPVRSGIGGEYVGDVISVTDNGTWTNAPTSFLYQWHNSNGVIVGATSSTYTVQIADVNSGLHCEVTAVNAGGNSLPAETDVFTTAPATLTNTSAPVASDNNGGAHPADITTTDGSWDSNPPGPTFTYNWYKNMGSFPGMTNTVSSDTAGDYYCEILASNALVSNIAANSNTVSLV